MSLLDILNIHHILVKMKTLIVIQPLKGSNQQLGDFYLVHNGNINNLEMLIEQFNIQHQFKKL